MAGFLDALFSSQQDVLGSNPWYTGGASLVKTQTPAIGGGFLGGFLPPLLTKGLGGLAMGYGEGQVEAEKSKVLQGLLSSPEDQWGETLKGTSYEGDIGNALVARKLEKKQKAEDFLNEYKLKAKLADPYATIPEFEVDSNGDVQLKEAQQPIGMPVDSLDTTTGRPTLNQQRLEAIAEGRRSGIPKSDLYEYANKKIAPLDKEAERERKRVEEIRSRAYELESIGNRADAAINKAGSTGGFDAGLKRFGDNVLYKFGSEDAAQRMAGDTELQRLSVEMLAQVKPKGLGALDRWESEQLYKGTISPNQTPTQNRALQQNVLKQAKLENEHANFLSSYIESYGHARGVQEAWQGYKKLNPILVPTEDGSMTINEDRTPWTAYDMQKLEAIGRGDVAAPPSDNLGLGSPESSTPPPSAPPGYELTGKVDANGNFGIRKIR